MNYFDFLTPSIREVLSVFFGALVLWFFQRKKESVDISTVEIDNNGKLISQYREALDDLPPRYEEKYQHIKAMATEVEALFYKKEQILLQEIEYHKQQATYSKKQAALYKRMYEAKVREFNDYKKTHP